MLSRTVADFIKKNKLFSDLDRVLVGVSGGPDSLALLHILNDLKVQFGIKIVVGHYNHGLRGKASDLDEKLVRKTCEFLGVDFICRKAAVRSSGSFQKSEESLRIARHSFFFATAEKYKLNKIALAHTLDDQAETVLMRLVRGSGLYGMIAMMPKKMIDSYVIVRPFLCISRKQIQQYLRKKRIKPRFDASNRRTIFTRNKIRLILLKEMKKLNPNISYALSTFSQQAALDHDYLYSQAAPFVRRKKDVSFAIALKDFRCVHESVQRMMVRIAFEKSAGSLRAFTSAHWDQVRDLAENRPVGSIVQLVKGVQVKKQKDEIVVYRQFKPPANK